MELTIFSIFAGIFFAAPFLIWTVIRFIDKARQKYVPWHKLFIILSIVIGWTIAIIFVVLIAIYI